MIPFGSCKLLELDNLSQMNLRKEKISIMENKIFSLKACGDSKFMEKKKKKNGFFIFQIVVEFYKKLRTIDNVAENRIT